MCPSALGIDEARVETAHQQDPAPPEAAVRRVADDNGLTIEQVLELIRQPDDEAATTDEPGPREATPA